MIVMAVGNEDVDETLALGCGSDRLQMKLVGRSRIDDGHAGRVVKDGGRNDFRDAEKVQVDVIESGGKRQHS